MKWLALIAAVGWWLLHRPIPVVRPCDRLPRLHVSERGV